jgi:ectoine hydroxylase-related dioxygenase (phytanoyl-CoA dioxygenase family)
MKKEIVDSLNKVGICVIEDYFPSDWCDNAVSHMEDALVTYKDKVQSQITESTSGDFRVFKMENQYDTAKQFADDKFLLDVGTEYFGNPIVSHFVLGGKVQHNPNQTTNSGGGWHRDNRGKQIKTIVYLTDVSEESGPFSFLPLSNQFDLQTRDGIGKATRYDDSIVDEFCKENNIEPFKVIGKKGTIIFVDTSFIHRGLNIQSGSRYTYTNYYFENHPQRIQMSEDKWGKNYI